MEKENLVCKFDSIGEKRKHLCEFAEKKNLCRAHKTKWSKV